MDKKKYKTLIILGCVLVLLIVGIILYNIISAKVAEEKEAASEAESIANTIHATNLEEVSSISFNGLTFNYDSEEDTWSYADDTDFPLNSTTISSIANDFKDLVADRALEDGDTLENYGLENPAYTVTLMDGEGVVTDVKIGNTSNDSYYVMVNDDSSVIYRCVVSSLDSITGNLLSYATIEDVGAEWSGNANSITFTNGTTTLSFEKKTVEVVETQAEAETDDTGATEEATTSVSEEDVWYLSVDGETAYEVTDTDTFDDWLSDLDFSYTTCIAYNTEGEDLSSYNLDSPTYTITIGYTDDDDQDASLTIYIGGAYTDGNITAMSSLSDEIYEISASDFSSIGSALEEDFLSDSEDE